MLVRGLSSCQAGATSGTETSVPTERLVREVPLKGDWRSSQPPSICSSGNACGGAGNDPRKRRLVLAETPSLRRLPVTLVHKAILWPEESKKCVGVGRRDRKEASQVPTVEASLSSDSDARHSRGWRLVRVAWPGAKGCDSSLWGSCQQYSKRTGTSFWWIMCVVPSKSQNFTMKRDLIDGVIKPRSLEAGRKEFKRFRPNSTVQLLQFRLNVRPSDHNWGPLYSSAKYLYCNVVGVLWVHVYVCILCVCAQVCTSVLCKYVCGVCMCPRIHVTVYVHVCKCVYTCIRLCMSVCMCV